MDIARAVCDTGPGGTIMMSADAFFKSMAYIHLKAGGISPMVVYAGARART